jgi:uncharacterized protein YecE (DUF72 family)
MTVRIGISGWTYAPWRGTFYPAGLPQARELRYAAGLFRSIEINGTFYRLQRPEVFASWAEQVPRGFVFAVKGPRFITHIRRLRDADEALANFFASGPLALGAALGPFLWQLPPNFRFEEERIAAFLKLLPRDSEAAAALAARNGRGFPKVASGGHYALRHAMEIRHESFRCARFADLLRAHGVALVCADTVEWPRLGDVTADFVYCRLHGSEELYASGYGTEALNLWAARIKIWARGGEPADLDRIGSQPALRRERDVFVYLDNDRKVRAPSDAQALTALLAPEL